MAGLIALLPTSAIQRTKTSLPEAPCRCSGFGQPFQEHVSRSLPIWSWVSLAQSCNLGMCRINIWIWGTQNVLGLWLWVRLTTQAATRFWELWKNRVQTFFQTTSLGRNWTMQINTNITIVHSTDRNSLRIKNWCFRVDLKRQSSCCWAGEWFLKSSYQWFRQRHIILQLCPHFKHTPEFLSDIKLSE